MYTTLAQAWGDGGPGPWVLLFPLVWVLIVAGIVLLLRRTVWRGAPGRPDRADHAEQSPLAVLGRRFATGEVDEDEYRRRLSVLEEQFGRPGKGGAA
jgi:putative membrane protein